MTSAKNRVNAFQVFFPAASAYAAVSVPLAIYAALLGDNRLPGLLASGHGHEMIFGFALALIAGYTLGPQPSRLLIMLLALWLLARICWALAPDSWAAQILSPTFALVLARYVVPRFNAAKKWRNKIAAPLLLLICLMAPAFWIADTLSAGNSFMTPSARQLMQAAVLGLLLLMTFIGGRLIAPAVAGTLGKQGIVLEARVQPRIEGTLIVVLGLAAGLSLLSAPPAVVGLPLLTGAALIGVRTTRWRLWHCLDRVDLAMLALGYFWLAIGAAVTAAHLMLGKSVTPALHLITIGALGTLSTGIMLRLAWQRARRRFPPGWQVLLSGALVSVAAIGRYLAGPMPFSEPGWLWLSAGCWSLAYLIVTGQLILLSRSSSSDRK